MLDFLREQQAAAELADLELLTTAIHTRAAATYHGEACLLTSANALLQVLPGCLGLRRVWLCCCISSRCSWLNHRQATVRITPLACTRASSRCLWTVATTIAQLAQEPRRAACGPLQQPTLPGSQRDCRGSWLSPFENSAHCS